MQCLIEELQTQVLPSPEPQGKKKPYHHRLRISPQYFLCM